MDEMKDFLKKLCENPKAQELISQAKEPAGMEEAAAMYADIAEKAGISVSKDTLQQFLTTKEKAQQEATGKAEGAVKQALGENDLESVAGGSRDPRCQDTFETEGEWCWFTDACDFVISYYDENSPCRYDAYNYPAKPKTYTTFEEEFPSDPDDVFLESQDLVCPFSKLS